MLRSDFDALKISLASPEEIKSWSHGEVLKPETINYRTLKPEKDGLFDERIFGPTKDFQCYCGKYKTVRFKGVICDKCGVEVTQSRVRRERMAHITLTTPCVHTWFFKRTPHILPALLDIGLRDLEGVIYYADYLVTKIEEEKREETEKALKVKFNEKEKELQEETKTRIKELEQELKEKIAKVINKKPATTEAQKGTETPARHAIQLAGVAGRLKKPAGPRESVELKIDELKRTHQKEVLFLRDELLAGEQELRSSFNEIQNLVSGLSCHQVLTEADFANLQFWQADNFFKTNTGAEAIKTILENYDFDKELKKLRKDLEGKSVTARKKATKRLKVVRGLKEGSIDPNWMILSVLPVIPPDLRPMVQLPGGRFATSDLNDLYRRVINRNNRLKNLISLGAPNIILQNEKRMLQEAIDGLIEGPRRPPRRGQKVLRSLSDYLKGKQGRFRRNLLGKRVDYSGRSVIVVGPELRVDQVGLPKEMALELFKPFVLRELILEGHAPNLKAAKNVLEQRDDEVWDILERVTKDHPVFLNRAPTLYRQNIQAFYPILIDGEAIQFHPIIVGAFAGDFDGDALSVHVPLSQNAISESREKLLTPHNLLKLADGRALANFKNEIGTGLYYLTSIDINDKRAGQLFLNFDSAITAYQNEQIGLRTPIKSNWKGTAVETSVGRILFNEVLPEELRFLNKPISRHEATIIITNCFEKFGEEVATKAIDNFKDFGRIYACLAGISYSFADFTPPSMRAQALSAAEEKIANLERNYRRGLLTEREKHLQVISIWDEVTKEVADAALATIDPTSALGTIINSESSKVNPLTLRQVIAMRGAMTDSQGNIKETPIRTSAMEGSTAYEGFLSAVGGRKGLIDTALLTSDAGYLTRRLVDVAHEVLTREVDCGTKEGITVSEVEGVEDWPLKERIVGRVAAEDIYERAKSKEQKAKILIKRNEMITEEIADKIIAAGITEVPIRSLLTCQSEHGVCNLCYGQDMSTKKLVEPGVAVGVIAAQSIGEPGTQLTLRTFHAAGVARKEITQGLPRVEELLEARSPKIPGILSDLSGVVDITEEDEMLVIKVFAEEKVNGKKIHEEREYRVPVIAEVVVKSGDYVTAGDALTSGHLDLREIMKLKGILAVQKYLLCESQKVYKSQGVTIQDKHFEIIIRKMADKVRVNSPGDTEHLPGDYLDLVSYQKEKGKLKKAGKESAEVKRVLLGISRASIITDSWLSAASFEETPNVLTQAAVNARPQVDHLLGLKENVIIGHLIPTGKRAKLEG